MAVFLVPDAKKTSKVDFRRPIDSYIANTYDNVQISDFIGSVRELNTLREGTCDRSPDKHDTGLDLIVRYYDQLQAIETKLPIAENKIVIKFTWSDAFYGGGLLGKKASMVSAMYERCCVLFNTAVLQGQIAKTQNLDGDEGLKTAARHFQGAAGSYQRLRELVFAHLQTPPTPDMGAESTVALQALMLAQAQELFVMKASRDKMKPLNVAKLAMQASDLYADAYTNMMVAGVKEMWDKPWLPTVVAKQSYFSGMAQYYMGMQEKDEKHFGPSLARMQKAMELLKDADRKGSSHFSGKAMAVQVQRDHDAVKKDNDFIYNDRVPKLDTLEAIPKMALAKPVQFPSPSPNFVDVFSNLLPTDVYQAVSAYNAKRDGIVSGELRKLQDATQAMNSALAEWNLPACIEDTGDDAIPESILEKNKSVIEQGGLAKLDELMSEMPELVTRNKEILAETSRMLDEEERDDTGLRDNFKEKWTRTPSSELNKGFREEVAKYQGVLDRAGQADVTVKEKYSNCRKAVEILSKPEGELAQLIPKGGATAARSGSQNVAALKQLMEEVATLKAEREVVMKELKDPISDITPKFMEALKDEGVVDEESLSEAHLSSAYSKLQEQVADNVAKQNQIMSRVEEAYKRFSMETGGGASPREQMLKQLAAGYDTFMELINNLSEGGKFYNDLAPLLVRQQSKVNDYAFARKTEKDEQMKDLQRSFANQPTPAPAQPPSRPPPAQPPSRPPPSQQAPAPAQAPPPSQLPPAQQPYQPPVQAQVPAAWGQQPSAPPPGQYGYQQQPPPQGYYQPGGYQPAVYYPPQGYPPQQFNTYYPPAPQGTYYMPPGAQQPQYRPPH